MENVEKVDLIYICSPNNPTGAVYNKLQLKTWVDYAIKNQAIILFDSAYECFISDKELPRSIFEIEGAKQCAIEFQGEQHFKIVNFGNKTEKEMLDELKRIQKRDARKLCLCEQNGIKIHYINYTEKDNIKEKIKEIIYGTTC